MTLPPGPYKQPRYGIGPIYDANGKLVSFTEHATAIMDRLNEADKMEAAVKKAERERDHWKNNHDHIKMERMLLRDRHDLPEPRKHILDYFNDKIEALKTGLEAAAKTMRNVRGAIESNQITDKDVLGNLKRGETAARDLTTD